MSTTAQPVLTIENIFDSLPKSEKTLWKRINAKAYSFDLINDMGSVNEFRVVVNGTDKGIIKYYKGRKLVAHGLISKEEQQHEVK